MRTVHYLHIGKTAGTQIKHVIEQINALGQPLAIKGHRHAVKLIDLPPDAEYFLLGAKAGEPLQVSIL